MTVPAILTNVAILLVLVAIWDDMRRGGRLTPARKTWLLVAAIFTAVSLAHHLFK
jgi:low affinity Fe/Cu permease